MDIKPLLSVKDTDVGIPGMPTHLVLYPVGEGGIIASLTLETIEETGETMLLSRATAIALKESLERLLRKEKVT